MMVMRVRKFEWKDETSYSRGERGNVPPRVLATNINGIRIIIHRHIHYSDTWLLSSRFLNIDNKDLCTNELEKAEEKAKEIILNTIYEINKVRDYILGLD